MDEKKGTAVGAPSQSIQAHNSKKPGKLESMFRVFAGGRRLHRFQAEILGDHCLHSSISGLQTKHGVTFSRKWIKVPNRFGTETRVMLYWLEGKDLERAQGIIGIRQEVAA